MIEPVKVGDRLIGPGQPVYTVAEIGINHNGDVGIACRLIDAAADAGFDAVKFQKRTPELCVPPDQRHLERDTPWGRMTYLDYRHRIELGTEQFSVIAAHCRARKIAWFASCWDEPSVDFIEQFDPPCHKLASASITNEGLVGRVVATGRPIILSTGMSSPEEIRAAVELCRDRPLVLTHATSAYPCPPEETNLRMIQTLEGDFACPVGYSGHEIGLQITLAAVALGACCIERHVTLDRAMWGSDHAASVEPQGMARLIRDIRIIERAMGDGVKRVYASELASKAKLRAKNACIANPASPN